MNALRELWRDEDGFIVSTELVLVATLLVMALVVGLQSVRDSALAELADVAAAIGYLNQSYSFAGVRGHASYVAGSVSIDYADFCDTYFGSNQYQFSQCVTIVAPTFESLRPGMGAGTGVGTTARVITGY